MISLEIFFIYFCVTTVPDSELSVPYAGFLDTSTTVLSAVVLSAVLSVAVLSVVLTVSYTGPTVSGNGVVVEVEWSEASWVSGDLLTAGIAWAGKD